MYKSVESLETLEATIKEDAAVLLYISHDACNVCKVLKPEIATLFDTNFPQVQQYYIDSKNQAEIAAQYSVFAVPTVIIYLDGKEFFRESRNISLTQLKEKVARPYELFFS